MARSYLPAGPRAAPVYEARPFTVAFEPRPRQAGMSTSPMIDGKYGSFPSGMQGGMFDRMFLFGTPAAGESSVWHDNFFAFGQGQSDTHGMPGFEVVISGKRHAFSLEVVAACSAGHLDVRQIEELSGSLRQLAEKEVALEDACVTLGAIIQGLAKFPLVGYAINPPIVFISQDDLAIRGVPHGMRLYLTGRSAHDVR